MEESAFDELKEARRFKCFLEDLDADIYNGIQKMSVDIEKIIRLVQARLWLRVVSLYYPESFGCFEKVCIQTFKVPSLTLAEHLRRQDVLNVTINGCRQMLCTEDCDAFLNGNQSWWGYRIMEDIESSKKPEEELINVLDSWKGYVIAAANAFATIPIEGPTTSE